MKLSAAIVSVAAAMVASTVVDAFSISTPHVGQHRRSVAMSASSQPDSKALAEEAMKISEEYGASSMEARLAWETVEEVSASDNSEVMKGSAEDACEVEGPDSELCKAYNEKLEALQAILEKQGAARQTAKPLTEDLKNVKLASPTKKAHHPPSKQLEDAIRNAQAATEEHGIRSKEAKLAWETVEEIASSSRSDNAMGGMLTDECLVDAAVEACAALEELNRVLDDSKNQQA